MEREKREPAPARRDTGERQNGYGIPYEKQGKEEWRNLPDWRQKDLSDPPADGCGRDASDRRKRSEGPGESEKREDSDKREDLDERDAPDNPDTAGEPNPAEDSDDSGDQEDQRIRDVGQVRLADNREHHEIHLLSIIGEIEGHDNLSGNAKTTKYEHILPKLAAIEDSSEIQGVLVILNTMGGDVEAGLAIAEMLSSLSKPTVSLVLGGSHSIGVPIAVSCDYSFIVPTGTMVIHPVRMNGMVIGVPQTFEYFKLIQDRITGFICRHSGIPKARLEELMTETGFLTKDVGTILVGEEAVRQGIIDEVGGIDAAMRRLHQMIATGHPCHS